jgi:fermentation-respiration switch protein FrsA (DUF1100 family)
VATKRFTDVWRGEKMIKLATPEVRLRLANIADGLVVSAAVALPWSTSATLVLLALWLGFLIPTLSRDAIRDAVTSPSGAIPLLLSFAAAIGTLWATVGWAGRLGDLSPFHRLLAIPLLLAQFRSSENGSPAFSDSKQYRARKADYLSRLDCEHRLNTSN